MKNKLIITLLGIGVLFTAVPVLAYNEPAEPELEPSMIGIAEGTESYTPEQDFIETTEFDEDQEKRKTTTITVGPLKPQTELEMIERAITFIFSAIFPLLLLNLFIFIINKKRKSKRLKKLIRIIWIIIATVFISLSAFFIFLVAASGQEINESELKGSNIEETSTTLHEGTVYLSQPLGPGEIQYLHIFGYKIGRIYQYESLIYLSAIMMLLQLILVLLIISLSFLRFRVTKKQKTKKTILRIIIFLAIIFALTFSVSFSADAKTATLDNLSVPYGVAYKSVAADVDLHAYDDQGRHTGMNYETGEYENEIPEAIA